MQHNFSRGDASAVMQMVWNNIPDLVFICVAGQGDGMRCFKFVDHPVFGPLD